MKAVMVMYDSLDKHFLECYGCDWTHTPNFNRLAEKCIRFDDFYVGSMPCMPARRELHTGRYSMLHRDWGPLEPFDDSMPEILKKGGVYTHLCTDHYHYFQDGGATYHNRFSSWEGFRGQEGDAWKGEVAKPNLEHLDSNAYDFRKTFQAEGLIHDEINRKYIQEEEQMPQSLTFSAGLEFIHTNHDQDNWFLDIETFDPHEPFFCRGKWSELYPHQYHGGMYDWPQYKIADEDEDTIQHVRMEYAALVSKCDDSLGKVLDAFDTYDLWKDTMLIVCTDHGFLLGEHQWWGKTAPLYQEVVNTPFFIYDPRSKQRGCCSQLCQTIDIAPTLLEFFGMKIPKNMQGKPLSEAYMKNKAIRQEALYGFFGSSLCITDARYTYFRAPQDINRQAQYTLMPTVMDNRMSPKMLKDLELVGPFSFTKGMKVLKISKAGKKMPSMPHDLLFDLDSDPGQKHNIVDYELRARLCQSMVRLMKENDAPDEAYLRYGLHDKITAKELEKQECNRLEYRKKGVYKKLDFEDNAAEFLHTVLMMLPEAVHPVLTMGLQRFMKGRKHVTLNDVDAYFQSMTGNMKPLAQTSRLIMANFLPEEDDSEKSLCVHGK